MWYSNHPALTKPGIAPTRWGAAKKYLTWLTYGFIFLAYLVFMWYVAAWVWRAVVEPLIRCF